MNLSEEIENALGDRAIVFIGLPGTGKTSIGTRIAQWLDYKFLDTDDTMRQRGYAVPDQPVILGDAPTAHAKFLNRETEVLSDLLAFPQGPTIIATGGSIVLHEYAQKLLKGEKCFTVNLIANLHRISAVRGYDRETLDKLHAERWLLYEECEDAYYNTTGSVQRHVDRDAFGVLEMIYWTLVK